MSTKLEPIKGMSAVTALRWKYLQKKGWSQAELSRQVGRSDSSIAFLFNSRDGRPYKGQRPWRAGDTPLADLVDVALGIPEDELKAAQAEDEQEEAQARRSKARAELRAKAVKSDSVTGRFPNEPPDLRFLSAS